MLPESGTGSGQLIERGQGIAKHSLQIELSGWLIQASECCHIVGIRFKQLPDEPLRNLIRIQVHAVQCAEQSRQLKPCGLQPRAQIRRNLHRFVVSHSIAHTPRQVNTRPRRITRMPLTSSEFRTALFRRAQKSVGQRPFSG